jgi:DNA replication licensing factor MCM2
MEDQDEPKEHEEEVDPAQYKLDDEQLGEAPEVEERLRRKISLSFQQFLLKFMAEGGAEPHYPELIKKMAEEHQRHLDVSYMHLQSWDPMLGLWVADFPSKILPILNETLMNEAVKRFGTYQLIRATEETELRVAVCNFSISENIRDLTVKHLGNLVSVTGVATKRSGVFNQVKRLYVRCAKCNTLAGPFDVAEDKDTKPGSCIECQSRGPWKVDKQKTLYRNYQKITLQESPGTVEPGKMPRSKEVIVTGDQVDTVRPGDNLSLTGIYRCLYDAATNARNSFPVYRTEIDAIHLHRKGDVKAVQLTEEMQQKILDLAKSPNIRERFIASMAPSIYGMHHVKTAIATSMMGGQSKMAAGKHRIRGDINTLLVGDPGLAKSQFLKYIEQTFPRAVYTTGKGASAVGLTASVQRDENGDFALQGGAMVLADDGMCLIDEFDKMNDNDRTSLHEAMEQQTISISKAGIVATLQARCSVVAVANPTEGRYDPQRTFEQNVNLTGPILSRFDILCVLRDESDAVQDEKLADHVVSSHIRSHPDANSDDKKTQPKCPLAGEAVTAQPIDQDILKAYICYARQRVFPKISDLDYEKLANFYKDIRAEAFKNEGAPMTARHIESIVRMSEANARMELRSHVISKDLDNAIGLMLESFIQSQKHQVAEELRRKFRRYISQAIPTEDQFVNMLQKLFSDRIEQLRLSRPGTAEPELEEVDLDLEDVKRRTQRADLEVEDLVAFLRTERFQQHFRLDDNKMYRVA